MQEPWLILVEQSLERSFANGVAILIVGWNVEQQNIHTCVGHLARDAQSHGSCANYGSSIYLVPS